ncbi:MAG: hypothetical protein JRI68_32545 [Deltaproteobacteria bacterium]|nr:hypothetical protein [Deltaproteobacteria bacterium]
MTRTFRMVLIGLGLTLTLPATSASGGPPKPAQAPQLKVGSELTAVRDVTLREATLIKGSQVTVVHIAKKAGKTVALNLELKDGHVLRGVAFRKVRDNFRHAKR